MSPSQPNGRISEFIRLHWWKAIIAVFTTGMVWQTVQGKLLMHEERIAKLEKHDEEYIAFMAAQTETNKSIVRIEQRMDRWFSRR